MDNANRSAEILKYKQNVSVELGPVVKEDFALTECIVTRKLILLLATARPVAMVKIVSMKRTIPTV